MKLKGLLIGLLLAGVDAFFDPAVARDAGLRFVTPRPNQVVGGDNVLLWATEAAVPPARGAQPKKRQVVFEASTDNRTFRPLPRQSAPDFGLFSRTSAFDTAAFPSGRLFLRVRYADQRKGPTIRVRVNRLPEMNCKAASELPPAYTVFFDCTGSRDPDGRIVRYLWRFGDGTTLETDKPLALHTFPSAGTYPFELTAFDNRGLSSTLIRLVTVTTGIPDLVPSKKCGCKKMVVRAGTDSHSALKDPRREDDATAPLGPDPDFPSFNFEVEVDLEEGSDPDLCTEGQEVRGTITAASSVFPKKACAAGNLLPICAEDADCHNFRCSVDNTLCNGAAFKFACEVLKGGKCEPQRDGVCEEFPFAGNIRGNDDYQSPSDLGVKEHGPGATIRWFDGPGIFAPKAVVNFKYRQEGDFLMFVNGTNGGGSCQCHVHLLVNWDGKNQEYGEGNGITLIADNETSANCSVVD